MASGLTFDPNATSLHWWPAVQPYTHEPEETPSSDAPIYPGLTALEQGFTIDFETGESDAIHARKLLSQYAPHDSFQPDLTRHGKDVLLEGLRRPSTRQLIVDTVFHAEADRLTKPHAMDEALLDIGTRTLLDKPLPATLETARAEPKAFLFRGVSGTEITLWQIGHELTRPRVNLKKIGALEEFKDGFRNSDADLHAATTKIQEVLAEESAHFHPSSKVLQAFGALVRARGMADLFVSTSLLGDASHFSRERGNGGMIVFAIPLASIPIVTNHGGSTNLRLSRTDKSAAVLARAFRPDLIWRSSSNQIRDILAGRLPQTDAPDFHPHQHADSTSILAAGTDLQNRRKTAWLSPELQERTTHLQRDLHPAGKLFVMRNHTFYTKGWESFHRLHRQGWTVELHTLLHRRFDQEGPLGVATMMAEVGREGSRTVLARHGIDLRDTPRLVLKARGSRLRSQGPAPYYAGRSLRLHPLARTL